MRLSLPRWATGASRFAARQPSRPRSKATPKQSIDNRKKDIVNPDLCTDAIRLLRESLPTAGSCDIIDINPGTCVWSQALHKALKPRRHVLVELEQQRYADALDPLLSHPDSNYRHTTNVSDALDESQDLLSTDLRSRFSKLDSEQRKLLRKETTDQLIVTANLNSKNVHTNGYRGSLSKLFIDQYCRAIAFDLGATDFARYGMVKLLAWIPDKVRYAILPRTTPFRTRLSKHLEACFDVREIVGGASGEGYVAARCPYFPAALQSSNDVAEIQSELGIRIPKNRRQPPPDPPFSHFEPEPQNFPQLSSLKTKPPLVNKFISAYKAVDKDAGDLVTDSLKDLGLKAKDLSHKILEVRKFYKRMKVQRNHYRKVEALVQEQMDLEQQLIRCRRVDPNPRAYSILLEKLKPQFDDINSRYTKFFKDDRHAFLKGVDDTRALLSEPHALEWYNRTFEPLLCQPSIDFRPHQSIALIEFTPKPSFLKQVDTGTKAICFDYVTHMFESDHSNYTVNYTLERLLGTSKDTDTFQDFVKQVPSLTDPSRGGFYDLDKLRVRTLPSQTLIDVALAYEQWPFRKDTNTMLDAATNTRGKKVY